MVKKINYKMNVQCNINELDLSNELCVTHDQNYNMEDPYWIVGSAIIFKPQFDSCLDDYIGIISNCDILIFSNYNELNTTLKNDKILKNNEILFTG